MKQYEIWAIFADGVKNFGARDNLKDALNHAETCRDTLGEPNRRIRVITAPIRNVRQLDDKQLENVTEAFWCNVEIPEVLELKRSNNE